MDRKIFRNLSFVILFLLFIGFGMNSTYALAKSKDFEIKDKVLLKYTGHDEIVSIPEGVKEIESQAFSGNQTIKEVIIPDSVINIYAGVFENCTQLESVILPEGLEYLNGYVFSGCINLKDIVLPDSLRGIGDSTFMDCSSLENIIIPNSVVFIGWYAFQNCSSLSNMVLPEKIERVGPFAFENTKWLNNYPKDVLIVNDLFIRYLGKESTYKVPSNITKIVDGAFYNVTSIEEVVLPKGIVSIGADAFGGCTNLVKINIPEGVTSIDSYAFSRCSKLKDIKIPSTVQNFGQHVFRDSSYYKNYPDDFLIINNILLSYLGNKEIVTIPNNVHTININAFSDNHMIRSIIIPSSVKNMRIFSLFNCSKLEKVVIPDSVISIDEQVIYDCGKNLEVICVSGSAADKYSKQNNIKYFTISLNKTSVSLYKGKASNTFQLKINNKIEQSEWQSSDKTVAVVSNTGLITAKKQGTAYITTVINDLTLTCKVTVSAPRLNRSAVVLKVGQTYNLQVLGYPENIEWKSSDSKIAQVDSKGKVTAKKKGKVKITAEVEKKTYTSTIIVR